MKIQLIADSCCDVTPAMRNTLHLQNAPLKITVGGKNHYTDDGTIKIKTLLADMKESKMPIATAAPSPEDYASLMRESEAAIVVTLSCHLSGSYNAAASARDIVLEETPDKPILVFDSKSASAGELRLVLFIAGLIAEGAGMEDLARRVPLFISGMRTYFVLEDLGNLVKNGRIPKVAGLLGSMLMLRPIMGENGNGEIISLEKIRGTQKALARLVEILAETTLGKSGLLLTLSHCNCPERALEMKKDILAACPAVEEVIVTPTGGLSACYANNGGIVVAVG